MKRNFKIFGAAIAALVLAIMVIIPAFAADSMKITVGTVTAKAGDTVDVPVYLSGNPGIAGFSFDVTFDKAKLEYLGCTEAKEVFPVTVAFIPTNKDIANQNGKVSVTASNKGAGGLENSHDDGKLAVLRFKIANNVAGTIPLNLTSAMAANADDITIIISVEKVSGAINIESAGGPSTEPTTEDPGDTTEPTTEDPGDNTEPTTEDPGDNTEPTTQDPGDNTEPTTPTPGDNNQGGGSGSGGGGGGGGGGSPSGGGGGGGSIVADNNNTATESSGGEIGDENNEPTTEPAVEVVEVVEGNETPLFDLLLLSKTHEKYITGYENGTVRPDASLTREVAAQMLYNILGSPESTSGFKLKFGDVGESRWSHPAIAYLVEQNVLKGYPDGSFKPAETMTRAEFCTMLCSFMKLALPENQPDDMKFSDLEGHWAWKYIIAMSEKGYIQGYLDGTFGPDRQITRAEAITFINRIMGRRPDFAAIAELGLIYSDLNAEHWAYRQIIEAMVTHDYEYDEAGENEIWELPKE
ncbi:MAG: S-layer homology domain-containing protein [Oscillospiraceae bacterium]|nr:S-layer homology domain-containing protein [Oscillospiraceae bacterium]